MGGTWQAKAGVGPMKGGGCHTDALSRRPMSSISHLRAVHLPRLIELSSLGVRLELTDSGSTDSEI